MTRAAVPASGRLARLAELAHDRRRLFLGGWIAALVLISAIGAAAKGAFKADYSTPGSQSRAAADLLKSRFPAQSPETVDVVWVRRGGADAVVARFVRRAAALPGIGDAPALSEATPTERQGSHMTGALGESDGFAIAPADAGELPAGAPVDVLRLG